MGYLAAILVTSLATLLCWQASFYLDHSNLIMIYLLCIVYIATRFGRASSILASFLSLAEFDYFCVNPRFSLAITDWQFIITFTVMLTIAILISTLTSELQDQAEQRKKREKRSEALRALSTDLSRTRGWDKLTDIAIKHIRTFFDAMVGVYLPDPNGKLLEYTADRGLVRVERQDNEIALWAYQHREACGLGRGPFAQASSLYLPLIASKGAVGVLQVSPRGEPRIADQDDMELLETFANHAAHAIEVAQLSELAKDAAMRVEREQLRNALLSSVSHDLRTPLATITGASSSLVESRESLNEAQKQELAEVILEEAEHLNKLVRNILDMSRLESGPLAINKSWHSIEEIVGSCMTRLEPHLGKRQVSIKIPKELPLIPLDELLIQQVLMNLLENAIKYSDPDSEVEIEAALEDGADSHPDKEADKETNFEAGSVLVTIADRGPGIVPGEEEKIFAKFYRSNPVSQQIGVGLGLTICRAIINAHGGSISAANRRDGGTIIKIRLPLEGSSPSSLPLAEEANETGITGNNIGETGITENTSSKNNDKDD